MLLHNSKELSALRKTIHDAFNKAQPGEWFSNVTDRIRAIRDEQGEDTPLLAMGFDVGKAFVFAAGGQHIAKYKDKDIDDGAGGRTTVAVEDGVMKHGHRGWLVDITDGALGCAPCVGVVDGNRYAAGLMIVTGRGDVGKTPLVHALGCAIAGDEQYACIRFGEPLSGYQTDFDKLIDEIALALIHHRVIVIDSLKDVIGSIGGNATSGGISRGAFQLLSDLGALATSRGSIIIASLNPTSNDPKIVDLVVEAARSNSTSLAIPTTATGEWEIISRTGEGQQRVKHYINTSYGEYSVLNIGKSKDKPVSGTIVKSTQVVITNSEVESALHRLTKV